MSRMRLLCIAQSRRVFLVFSVVFLLIIIQHPSKFLMQLPKVAWVECRIVVGHFADISGLQHLSPTRLSHTFRHLHTADEVLMEFIHLPGPPSTPVAFQWKSSLGHLKIPFFCAALHNAQKPHAAHVAFAQLLYCPFLFRNPYKHFEIYSGCIACSMKERTRISTATLYIIWRSANKRPLFTIRPWPLQLSSPSQACLLPYTRLASVFL
jgi:hypothetical protein